MSAALVVPAGKLTALLTALREVCSVFLMIVEVMAQSESRVNLSCLR